MTIMELREEIREMAAEVRGLKQERKSMDYGYVPTLNDKRRVLRHMHIAYCELRGTPRECIERPAEDNKPNEYLIEKYKQEYGDEYVATTLCACA